MPRGIKRSRKEIITEEIENLKVEVSNAEELITEKRGRIEELSNELKLLESKELMNIIESKGLSLEEIKQMIETCCNDELECRKEVAATM